MKSDLIVPGSCFFNKRVQRSQQPWSQQSGLLEASRSRCASMRRSPRVFASSVAKLAAPSLHKRRPASDTDTMSTDAPSGSTATRGALAQASDDLSLGHLHDLRGETRELTRIGCIVRRGDYLLCMADEKTTGSFSGPCHLLIAWTYEVLSVFLTWHSSFLDAMERSQFNVPQQTQPALFDFIRAKVPHDLRICWDLDLRPSRVLNGVTISWLRRCHDEGSFISHYYTMKPINLADFKRQDHLS